jgi:hypothetical protein
MRLVRLSPSNCAVAGPAMSSAAMRASLRNSLIALGARPRRIIDCHIQTERMFRQIEQKNFGAANFLNGVHRARQPRSERGQATIIAGDLNGVRTGFGHCQTNARSRRSARVRDDIPIVCASGYVGEIRARPRGLGTRDRPRQKEGKQRCGCQSLGCLRSLDACHTASYRGTTKRATTVSGYLVTTAGVGAPRLSHL